MAAPLVGGALTCTNIAKATAAASFSMTKLVAGGPTAVSTANTNVFTFNNVDIGTAGASRVVYLQVYTEEDIGTAISSVTIGGDGATEIQNGKNVTTICANYYLLVTSGTSVTVVVTCDGAMLGCAIDVWRVEAATGNAPTNSGVDIATAYSIAATVPAGGAAAAGFNCNDDTGLVTWTGATEDHDSVVGTDWTYSAAEFTASGTITASGGNTQGVLVYASFGP